MKKQLFIICLLFLCSLKIVHAQIRTLWGMTPLGGAYNFGTVFKMNFDGSGYAIVHNFDYYSGALPEGNLIKASDGYLYGMAADGGETSYGVIFRISPSTNGYTVLFNFTTTNNNGTRPSGSLFQASDGKLYGMTLEGGAHNYGVLFSITISDFQNPIFTKLREFNGFDGANPAGNLMQASDGKLYGMTGHGGNNYGNLFSFDPVTKAFQSWNFGSNTGDGILPYGSLIQSGSYLYGTTHDGGRCGKGTVFNFNMTSHGFQYPAQFCGTQPDYGSYPRGSLLKIPGKTSIQNKYYGMTYGETTVGSTVLGNIFSFTDYTAFPSYPVTFDGANKGSHPQGSLIKAFDGKLYGMAERGGSSNAGVAFSLDLSNNLFTKIHTFTGGGIDGSSPIGDFLEYCAPPAIPCNITGASYVCPGTTTTYNIAPVTGATSYIWSVPSGATIVSGAGTTHLKVKFGNNTGGIVVKASNSCGISAPKVKLVLFNNNCHITISKITNESTDNAVVYPNPTSGNITVQFTSSISSKYIIHVVDVTGKILITDESEARGGVNLHQLNLSKLAKGIYQIELIGNNKNEHLSVVVK